MNNDNIVPSYVVTNNCNNIFNNQIGICIYLTNITNDIIIYINNLLNKNYNVTILHKLNNTNINNIINFCTTYNITNYILDNNITNFINNFNYYIAINPLNDDEYIHIYMINKSNISIAYEDNSYVNTYTHNFDKIYNIHNINSIDNNLINSIIPLNIYVTWNTKNLSVNMARNYEDLKQKNQEFTFHLYDNNDMENFIRENYDISVLNAYNKLKPGAYKADLWRYCIMYKYGGIYIDIKLKLINNFKLILLTDKEYYVLDNPNYFYNKCGIYNALLISLPHNKLYLDCINKIVDNVNNKYYGFNDLYPTGPGLLGEIYINNNLNRQNFILINKDHRLYYKDLQIITEYPEYRSELTKTIIPYGKYWSNKNIYE